MTTSLDNLIRNVSNLNQVRRLDKLHNEEFYLLSFTKDDTNTNKHGTFNIAGSTKNVYTITWYKNWYKDVSFFCNCPDQKSYCQKLNCVCKHVCFIVCRIGKIFDSNFFNSRKLSDEQSLILDHKLGHYEIDTDAVDTDLICKFSKLMNESNQTKKTFNNGREILEDDECPICYTELIDTTTNGNTKKKQILLACPTCKQWVHKKCMDRWLQTNDTCVYCRSDVWKQFGNHESEYINLNS